jgi:4-nitrophenyl phosphatase
MKELLSQARCFFLDMDGTFSLGERLIDGSLRFIKTLQQQGKSFFFLTNNSSKNRQLYAEKITRLGLPISEEKVFTSGEATALYLKNQYTDRSIYLVGTPALEDEFRSYGFPLTDTRPDLIVLGFDTTLTYQKLWKLCDYVRAGLPYFATHPDPNYPTEDGFMPDIGAVIAFVKASTGREPDVVIGKPNRIILDTLVQKHHVCLQDSVMVGDRLVTDIALGNSVGIPSCLVLSGETHVEELQESPIQPTYLFNDLSAIADWLIEHQVG